MNAEKPKSNGGKLLEDQNSSMPSLPTVRKLAAIVFVDIVGYTSTMGRDEGAAIRLLEEFRKTLYPIVQQHNGAVLKELGDGALISFDSVLEATHCAAMLQRNVKGIPDLRVRIGIHIGDVIIEEKDVFGSGVNVAAHVLPLALPGGIVVTEDVRKLIKNQPSVAFVSLGSRRLKGISTSMRLFAMKGDGLAVPDLKQRIASRPSFKGSLVAAGIFILALLSYLFVPEVRQFTAGETPSIAILSLKNLGPDTDEPYSYGITQDLILDITKAGLLRVAPIKDILDVQNTGLSLEKIAARLKVRYVMQANLKREAGLFLLTAQIVEAAKGKILRADSIQPKIFEAAALQGKLAEVILGALGVKASAAATQEMTKPRTTNPEAYELYLMAKYRFDKKKTNEDVSLARDLYEKALALDSTFASARVGLRMTYDLQDGSDQTQRIHELARAQADTLGNIGNTYYDRGDYSTALDYFIRGLKFEQEVGERHGEGITLNNIGNVYQTVGDYPKALDVFMKDLQINRDLGDRKAEGQTLNNIGNVYFHLGDYSQAVDHLTKSLEISSELGERFTEGTTIGIFGILHLEKQEYKRAVDSLRKAVNIFTQIDERQNFTLATSWLALAEGKFGNAFKAEEHGRRVAEVLASDAKLAEFTQIAWNMSQVYSLLGNHEKAAQYLEKAYNEVQTNAEKISDRTIQLSYLTNVKTNREIIAARERRNISTL